MSGEVENELELYNDKDAEYAYKYFVIRLPHNYYIFIYNR